MQWEFIVALVIAIPIILFPAVFVWYLNIGGIYAALRERGRVRIPAAVIRTMQISVAIIVPVAIYAFLIWFFYGHFGWQVAVAVAVAFPIILFVPALVWLAVISGLYQVVRDRMRRRGMVARRRAVRMAEEPADRKVI